MAKDYAKSFYKSKAWRDCREGYIKSVFGLCERCGNIGKIVHHKQWITSENINNPNITLNWNNLELLCQDCHNKEKMKTEKRYSFDEYGNILPPVPLN